MSIKSKRITKRIFATFLILSLTLCYFTISASAAQRYVQVNDTVYKSANAYGWEELPYGTDTGVVQLGYGKDKYITFYFDKFTVYSNYSKSDVDIGIDRIAGNLNDYYWSIHFDNSSGKMDYRINIVSDSPIYYKTSYDSGALFSGAGGTVKTIYVPLNGVVDGNTTNSVYSQSYKVYEYSDVYLSEFVGDWDMPSGSSYRTVYSNCYQTRFVSPYYYPFPASGFSSSLSNGAQVGYNVEYYPTVEYLQNYDIRAQIVTAWKEVVELQDITNDVLKELYTVNVYLETIKNYLNSIDSTTLSLYSLLDIYLPLLNYNLGEILTVLEEILQGPEYDSSEGIGSDSSFGDAAGGLMQNTNVPDSGISSIQNNLKGSFLLIRGLFDEITGEWFPLQYVITFLLGLSFIAYVLGRVIKNKMR